MSPLYFVSISDRGNKRPNNEDRRWPEAFPYPDKYAQYESELGQIFVVADGVGGQGAGEQASEIAIRVIPEAYYEPKTSVAQQTSDISARLKDAIKKAHAEIRARANTPETARMGTTVVAAVIHQSTLWVAWVGDSRAYYLPRTGIMERLTEDHSELSAELQDKKISWEELHYHPKRSRLTNSLSAHREKIEVSIDERPLLETGDQILLCTDGLTSEVPDHRIQSILRDYSLEETANTLVDQAKEEKKWPKNGQIIVAGGEDNITAIVIRIAGRSEPGGSPVPVKPTFIKPTLVAIVVMIVISFLIFWYFLRGFSGNSASSTDTPVAALTSTQSQTLTTRESLSLTLTSTAIPTSTSLSSSSSTPPQINTTAIETGIPLLTFMPTNTPTREIPPLLPTFTPTATPTPTYVPTPTYTPTPQPTTGNKEKEITLIVPSEGVVFPYNTSEVSFQWRHDGSCDIETNRDEGFELKVGIEGSNDLLGVLDVPVEQARISCEDGIYTLNVPGFQHLPGVGGAKSGTFYWLVELVKINPYDVQQQPLVQSEQAMFKFGNFGSPPSDDGGSDGSESSDPRQ